MANHEDEAWPSSHARFRPRSINADPMPWFWNSGSTATGESVRAGLSPVSVRIVTVLKRIWPAIVPFNSATNDSSGMNPPEARIALTSFGTDSSPNACRITSSTMGSSPGSS